MATYVRIFERIIATVHQKITDDDRSSYNTDFSGLLIPKDLEMAMKFREISSSLITLLSKDKASVFVMFYDTVAFCARFRKGKLFDNLNVRMVVEVLSDLPHSDGEPQFIIGSDQPTHGMSWNQVDVDDEGESCEIFPLFDFDGVCFYYAKRNRMSNP